MKKLFVLLSVISYWLLAISYGCGKVEQPKAKALVESLIHKIDSGAYTETSGYYTDEFNAGESVDARTQKYKDLKDAFGNVVSIECISAKDSVDPDDRPIVKLIFRVKHTKLTSLEAYIVVSQNGEYKVEAQDVKKEN